MFRSHRQSTSSTRLVYRDIIRFVRIVNVCRQLVQVYRDAIRFVRIVNGCRQLERFRIESTTYNKRECEVLVTCMDNVDDASTTFVDLYLDVDIPIDMEDLEIYNYELVKRICSKLSMLKDTKSNVSKVSMISSSTFRRSDTGKQAAAIAAEFKSNYNTCTWQLSNTN